MLQLSSYRGVEADIVAAMCRDAFNKHNNFGELDLFGCIDAACCFAPLTGLDSSQALVTLVLSTDKDVFTVADVVPGPKTMFLQLHSAKLDKTDSGLATKVHNNEDGTAGETGANFTFQSMRVLDVPVSGSVFFLFAILTFSANTSRACQGMPGCSPIKQSVWRGPVLGHVG